MGGLADIQLYGQLEELCHTEYGYVNVHGSSARGK